VLFLQDLTLPLQVFLSFDELLASGVEVIGLVDG